MKKSLIVLVLIILLFSGFYIFQKNQDRVSRLPSITPTPVVKEEPLEDQIIQALSQKNNWNASNVEVRINSLEGDYAKGDVKFKDEMGGGLWFAARVENTWKIVYDGNGIITCDQLIDYQSFPTSMIPACYDKQAEKLLTR